MFKSVKNLIFVCGFLFMVMMPIPASAASVDRTTPFQRRGDLEQLSGVKPLNGYDGGYYGYHLIPTFYINSVARDVSVTITTCNFPAGDSFDVLMNVIGTRGIYGIPVATVSSGSGGSLTFTFNIPASLYGLSQIAIRLQSNTGSGYFAYNWFYNNIISGNSGGRGYPPPYYGYSYYPTFFIASVVRNNSVTIVTTNLPPNDLFQVLMGPMGAYGVNGYPVTTFNTGSGGTETLTFSIPTAMYDVPQIAIRLQSISGSGFFAYNWFYNNTAY
jgi:hypothetical protein